MKLGVVDVGGGFRGVYATGVLDRFLEEGITFDLGIGVSAGSANLASFGAKQLGRNFRFYTVYGMRPQYAGLRTYLTKGSFLDLDYIYSTLSNSNGEDPLDFTALQANPMEYQVIAANALTGETRCFTKNELAQDAYDPLKASCAIPTVCRPYMIDGIPYFDGALADPVPIERAFEFGCDRVALILTKPVDTIRRPASDAKLAWGIRKKYPIAAENLMLRAERYNKAVAQARSWESEGRVVIFAPDDTCGVSTLTRKIDRLQALYAKGYADGAKGMLLRA